MKSYISYFKLKFKMGLQYRFAALAGITTQILFGLVYVSVYVAFYESNSGSLPMDLDELISYIWLGQMFFSMIYLWYKDKQILGLIKTGNIAYELCRPQDLYFMWYSKILGERFSNVVLRFLPVLLISLVLPYPFNFVLNHNIFTNILFLISLILSSFLMCSIVVLFHILCMFTLDEKGIINAFMIIADFLSGLTLPVPFLPKYIQNISNILPFRYISDFPFRFYIGNITINEYYIGILIQIIWIIILVIIGRILLKKALSRVVIQGG